MHIERLKACLRRYRCTSLLLVLSSALVANANAATLTAEAKILSVEYSIPQGVIFEVDEQLRSFIASGLTNDGFASRDSSQYLNTLPGNATAGSSVGVSQSSADARAAMASESIVRVDRSGNAQALAQVELPYQADGQGQVVVSARVRLAIDNHQALDGETAEAMAFVNDAGGEERSLEILYANSASAQAQSLVSLPQVLEQTFELLIRVDGPTSSHLILKTFAKVDSGIVPVPLPAALWLFTAGMAFVIPFASKKFSISQLFRG